MPQKKPLPQHLSHYPLKYIEYFDHDGIYAGNTDAQYLSLGISTWDNAELSLKVWRLGKNKHGDDIWLRMSEELPLHRPIDLVLLLLAEMAGDSELEPNTLTNQVESVEIIGNETLYKHETKSLDEYFGKYIEGVNGSVGELIINKLRTLKTKLDRLSADGKI